jgi:hypothetical protein
MNRLNFEDTIFILNMRIKTLRDTLHLSPPPELFLGKSLEDLAFIDNALEVLLRALMQNANSGNSNSLSNYIADTEWQFNQLLTEFLLESSPFSAGTFPETVPKIAALRGSSNARRKTLEESGPPAEIAQSEPVVTSAELSGLLGGV